MKTETMRVLALLMFASSLFGQRIIYNQTLDKQGQAAASTANKIASQPLTDQELLNLTTIEKQQIDASLQAGLLTMRTQIQAFGTWENVSRSVCKTLRILYAKDVIAAQLISADVALNRKAFDETCKDVAALKRERAASEERNKSARGQGGTVLGLKVLAGRVHAKATDLKNTASRKPKSSGTTDSEATDSSTDSWVNAAVDRASNVQQLLELANKIDTQLPADKSLKALQQIGDGFKQLGALIDTVNGIWDSYRGVSVDPRSLAPSREKLAASFLAVEADRVKELSAIRTANAMYLDDLATRLMDCLDTLNRQSLWYAPGEVELSLRSVTAKPARLDLIKALHLAAAGAAANDTPASVEAIRESITERRSALRRDAIYNGAYEQALQAAGQRLAAYNAAGVKPADVAALLYYISGMVSLPKIAF